MKIVGPPDEPNDNVVPFVVPLLSENYRRPNYYERDSCRHGPYIIDDRNRTVTCERCKKLIDPVMCLLEIADQWRTYHKPRLSAIRRYMEVKKQAGEDFDAWWQRVGRGRGYPTKKAAATEAWIVASTPDLKECEVIVADLQLPLEAE